MVSFSDVRMVIASRDSFMSVRPRKFQAMPDPLDDPPASAAPEPDQAWKALSLVNEWIRHAETKTSIVLAAGGVTGGALYNLVKTIDRPTCAVSVLAVVCGLAVFAVGGCAAVALVPRRRIAGQPEDFANLLFYSHVADKYKADEPTYVEVLSALTSNPAELTRHLANQIHANSNVAHRKFTWAGWATRALFVGLTSLGILAAIVGAQVYG